MNTQSFVFYESFYKQLEIVAERVGKETAYTLLKDIAEFGLYGVASEENSSSWLYGFEQMMVSIANAKNRYNTAIENGKRGGRPSVALDKEEVM